MTDARQYPKNKHRMLLSQWHRCAKEVFVMMDVTLCVWSVTADCFTHGEEHCSIRVIHLDVYLMQEVLELFQGHLVVFVLVRLAHAVEDPA